MPCSLPIPPPPPPPLPSSHFFLFAFCYYYYYFVSLRCLLLSQFFGGRGRRGRIVLPVNLPSFAFHMLCPAATPPPPSTPLLICPSVSHRAAISACLIHNLRGRSEHSVCSMKHGERRAALRPLHSSAQSERPPPASPSCCLLPCPLVSGSRARVARLTFMKL